MSHSMASRLKKACPCRTGFLVPVTLLKGYFGRNPRRDASVGSAVRRCLISTRHSGASGVVVSTRRSNAWNNTSFSIPPT